MFKSLRTTLSLAIGTMVILAVALTAFLGTSYAKKAFLKMALQDVAFITSQTSLALDPIAKNAMSPEEFAKQAAASLNNITERYFKANSMTGYALLLKKDGTVLAHPKLSYGSNLKETGEQAVKLLDQVRAANYDGTVFYQWQNKDESHPRDKFAVIQALPSHPDYTLWVTAYTTDDLLVPFRSAQYAAAAVGSVVLLLCIIWTIIMTTGVVRSIKDLEANVLRVAAGNLQVDESKSVRALQRRKDELGSMARAIRSMQESLRTLMGSIIDHTQSVMAASEELTAASDTAANISEHAAAAAERVAEGANSQSGAATEVHRTMDEFRMTIQQIAAGASNSSSEVQKAGHMLSQMAQALETTAGNAANVARGASQSAEIAGRGAQIVEKTVSGMERIRQGVDDASQRMRGLEELTAQIGEITEVISGIADQTNLLALNAAIEAARAGEHGRGFAVVADEVRKLAERSGSSARTITDLISRIQQRTLEVGRSMAAGTAEVQEGSRLASDAGRALKEILTTAERAAREVQGISTSAIEVQHGAQQVLRAFESVAAVTEQNTAATEEMAAGTTQVTDSVEHIASVCRASAQAVGVVASSVKELEHSSRELAEASRSLVHIAQDLQQGVARFKL